MYSGAGLLAMTLEVNEHKSVITAGESAKFPLDKKYLLV